MAERALNKKLLQRIHELEQKLRTDVEAAQKLIDIVGEDRAFEEMFKAKEQEVERCVYWAFLR